MIPAMVTRMTTVTNGKWSVSAETSSAYTGAILHVFQWHDSYRIMRKAECYGKHFSTADAAFAYALEHGFLQPYYRRVWCRSCRTLHTFLGKPSAYCERTQTFCK